MLRGSESNIELELCEDVPLHRVVQPSPHLQLLFIERLPILSLGEELIDAWLQFLQNLIREEELFTKLAWYPGLGTRLTISLLQQQRRK